MAECPSCHTKIKTPLKVYSPAIGWGAGQSSFPLKDVMVCDKCGLKLIVTTKSRIIYKITYSFILFFIFSFLMVLGHFLSIYYQVDFARIYIVYS